MKLTELLLDELAREAKSTLRVLELVPEDKLAWTPHAKSMSLGQLALHVAEIPGAIAELLSKLTRDVPTVPLPQAASREEILSALDHSIATAAARLGAWEEADLTAEWRMVSGTHTLLALPRMDMIRSILFNHWYHHRGQLIVYLRLLDVPIPGIYGPSADE